MSKKIYVSKSNCALVERRANGRCEYCKCLRKYSVAPFVIEHIFPLALGGANALENLAFCCSGCNQYKYVAINALDPVTARLVPLFNPRTEKWTDHFSWGKDHLEMIGITPTGRATVLRLKTNRAEIVNLRVLTKLTKEHPPMD